MDFGRSVLFKMFPLDGQRCPEELALSPEEDFREINASLCGGRADSGLSIILSPTALSGRVKDLLFQFCSTAAIEGRQRVIYVAARRLVSPAPVAVHRMPSLLEDEGTPAPHRLKFVYPRSFSELMAYFSALSGLREPALPDAIVVDGLESFVELASDDYEDDNGLAGGAAFFEEMRDGRLTRALSLMQEFSAGWSQVATSGCDVRKRKPVSIVVGYSADWIGAPSSLDRRMAAFCREEDPVKSLLQVWTS